MPNNNSITEFKKVERKIKNLGIDGIETIIGDYCNIDIYNALPIEAMHLIYFPTWLDIWRWNESNLLEDFSSCTPYGINSKEEFKNIFKEQFEIAQKREVKYMVLHISHVRPRDIFTLSYEYSSRDVLDAALEMINDIFIDDSSTEKLPALLIENLPWPGFTLKNREESLDFIKKINYKNKGIMFDLSHYLCLENFDSCDQGGEFLKGAIENMGELKNYIRGVHLNCSTSKKYLSTDFSPLLKKWESSSLLDRYHIEISHVKSIDTHSIFKSKHLSHIISSLNLEFLVYELAYTDLEDLVKKVRVQNSFLNLS